MFPFTVRKQLFVSFIGMIFVASVFAMNAYLVSVLVMNRDSGYSYTNIFKGF